MAKIVRFIIVKAAPGKGADVERLWKQNCGPLMIKQPGCLREELLRCREDSSEYISISEWESQQAIDAYLKSPDHEQIKHHTRSAAGMAITVKSYDLVGG